MSRRRMIISILVLLFLAIVVLIYQHVVHVGSSSDDRPIEVLHLTQSWLWDPYSEAIEDWQYFKLPRCIEAGPDGDLFVADTGNARVVRFWESGEHEIIGRSGAGPGEFERPVDLYIDHENRLLWVADVSLKRISLFSLHNGRTDFITSYGMPYLQEYPHIIPSLRDSSFYLYYGRTDQRIIQASKDGESLRAFGDDLISSYPLTRVHNDGCLCLTASRHLIFVSQFGPIIEKYSLDGKLIASLPFLEEEYLESLAETERRRKEMNNPNIIASFFEAAYVPYKSNDIYAMKGSNLFYVIDSTDMQMIREVRVTNPIAGHPIILFCVIEPESINESITMYALEFKTKGIQKLVPRMDEDVVPVVHKVPDN